MNILCRVKAAVTIECIVKVVQTNRLQRYGHVLRKCNDDFVKKKMYYFRGWGCQTKNELRKTWKEVVDNDTNDLCLKSSDAMDWRAMIGHGKGRYRCPLACHIVFWSVHYSLLWGENWKTAHWGNSV